MNHLLNRVVALSDADWNAEKAVRLDGKPSESWCFVEDMARLVKGPAGVKGMCEFRAANPAEVSLALDSPGFRCPFHHTSRIGHCPHVFRSFGMVHTGEQHCALAVSRIPLKLQLLCKIDMHCITMSLLRFDLNTMNSLF